jgi:hypothetical protein
MFFFSHVIYAYCLSTLLPFCSFFSENYNGCAT